MNIRKILALLICTLFCLACQKPIVTIDIFGKGTATVVPSQACQNSSPNCYQLQDNNATLTATPGEQFQFGQWSIPQCQQTASCQTTFQNDTHLYLEFWPQPQSVSVGTAALSFGEPGFIEVSLQNNTFSSAANATFNIIPYNAVDSVFAPSAKMFGELLPNGYALRITTDRLPTRPVDIKWTLSPYYQQQIGGGTPRLFGQVFQQGTMNIDSFELLPSVFSQEVNLLTATLSPSVFTSQRTGGLYEAILVIATPAINTPINVIDLTQSTCPITPINAPLNVAYTTSKTYHYESFRGNDLSVASTATVIAATNGVIEASGFDNRPNGWGYYLIQKTEDGRRILYSHLVANSAVVAVSSLVAVGDSLAQVGSVLHFEYAANELAGKVNPSACISQHASLTCSTINIDELQDGTISSVGGLDCKVTQVTQPSKLMAFVGTTPANHYKTGLFYIDPDTGGLTLLRLSTTAANGTEVIHEVVQPGSYAYITQSSVGTGNYTLALLGATEFDSHEPNEGDTQATLLSGHPTISGNLDSAYDVDWYKYTLSSTFNEVVIRPTMDSSVNIAVYIPNQSVTDIPSGGSLTISGSSGGVFYIIAEPKITAMATVDRSLMDSQLAPLPSYEISVTGVADHLASISYGSSENLPGQIPDPYLPEAHNKLDIQGVVVDSENRAVPFGGVILDFQNQNIVEGISLPLSLTADANGHITNSFVLIDCITDTFVDVRDPQFGNPFNIWRDYYNGEQWDYTIIGSNKNLAFSFYHICTQTIIAQNCVELPSGIQCQ